MQKVCALAVLGLVGSRLVAVMQTRHDTFTGFGQDNDTTVATRVSVQ